MRLFLGNLPYSLNEIALRERLAPYGEIGSVCIVRDARSGQSRGFGFVEVPREEQTEFLMARLDGLVLDGRRLRVRKARQRQDRPRRPRRSSTAADDRPVVQVVRLRSARR